MNSGLCSAVFDRIDPVVAEFDELFFTVAIDAEEDFDWRSPTSGTSYSTAYLRNLLTVEGIFAAYDVIPTYLLTYPVLMDEDVIRIIRRQLAKGRCALGVQLHPWVTPPLVGDIGIFQSYVTNLPRDLEEQKLLALKQRFIDCFGFAPTVYRAGRYGLSANTCGLLEKHGFAVDTSVAPRTSFSYEGGPDYSDFDCRPFWFGRGRDLLELPLCRSVVGWGGKRSWWLYHASGGRLSSRLHATSLLTRSRCAERITLSPEGNDAAAMRRLVRRLVDRGHKIFVLSFHSSSLQPGHNPYVRSKAELHAFYDRLSAILDYLARSAFRPIDVDAIPMLLRTPQSGGTSPR